MQSVKDNSRVQEIINDPEFHQKLQSGNPIDMLSNARLLELANIIYADQTETTDGGGQSNNTDQQLADDEASTEKAEKKATQIYSGTDKNGKKHFSDKPAD